MKKVLVLGLLAIVASAFTQQQASAWINSRFGMGVNWDYQSGGNSAVWGLWRNNQPGGADPVGGPFQGHKFGGYGYGAPCPTPGFVPGPAPKMIIPAPAPGSPAMIPMAIPMEQPAHSYQQGYVSPYQFATYPRPVYYYYYYPAYAQ